MPLTNLLETFFENPTPENLQAVWDEIVVIINKIPDVKSNPNLISNELKKQISQLNFQILRKIANERIWTLESAYLNAKLDDSAKAFYVRWGLSTATLELQRELESQQPVSNISKEPSPNHHTLSKTIELKPILPDDKDVIVLSSPRQQQALKTPPKRVDLSDPKAQQRILLIHSLLFNLLITYVAHLEKKVKIDDSICTINLFTYEENDPGKRKQLQLNEVRGFIQQPPQANLTNHTVQLLREYHAIYRQLNKEHITQDRGFVTSDNIKYYLHPKRGVLPGVALLICAFFVCFKSLIKSTKRSWTLDSHGSVFCRKTEKIFADNADLFTPPQIKAH